jgi:hypothetical protein
MSSAQAEVESPPELERPEVSPYKGLVLGRMGGFAANFLESGCSGVIAPYWPINDARAMEFSLAFYRKLNQGRALGEALQELRQDCPRDPTFRAFAYYGDPWARADFESLM